jgi:hypothetical protein
MKMLKVLKGDCLLQESCFNRIIQSKVFSKEEIKKLEKSYSFININVEKRDKIIAVENILNSFYETITEKASLERRPLELKDENKFLMEMMLQINNHIYRSYTSALKEAFIKGKASFKIIFFLPIMPAMLHELYRTIKALMSCLDKRIDWRVQCMVLRDKSSSDCKEIQMLNISKYVKLSTLSKNIQVHTLENSEKTKVNYGVYFQDRTLFFNTKANDLILEYGNHQNAFEGLDYKVNDLFKTYYDGASFNAYLSSLMATEQYVNNHHFGIRSYLSAVSIGDNFKKIHSHDFEKKPLEILDLYHKKESKILSENKVKMVQFICERGIETLLNEGYIPDYRSTGEPMDEASRLALIYDALVKASLGYSLRIMPIEVRHEYPFMNLIQFFEMHQKGNHWILARSNPPKEFLNKKEANNKGVMYAIVIEDPNLVESFELFCKHVIWHKTLNTDESVDRIKSLVVSRFENHEDFKIQYLKNKIKYFDLASHI